MMNRCLMAGLLMLSGEALMAGSNERGADEVAGLKGGLVVHLYCGDGRRFDAATGRILKKYDGTEMTQELVYDRGVLFVVVGDPVDTSSVGTGRTLWRKKVEATQFCQGTSLAVRGSNVVYATFDFVACLDRGSGTELWRTKAGKQLAPEGGYRGSVDAKKPGRSRYPHPHARRNTVKLVLSDEAVCLATGRSLTAFGIKDGAELWTANTHMNHHKSPDVLLTGGAVWTANRMAYDPLTGERIRALLRKMTGPMGHDRCHENRITTRWYINTVTGGRDFLSLDGSSEFPSPWGRGKCGIGHLPCNGLLYLGPPACSRGNKVQLNSMNALAADPAVKSSGQSMNITVDPRLEKGSAYAAAVGTATRSTGSDWPTCRHDAGRGGHTKAAVGAHIRPLWRTKLSTRVTAPVVVADRAFVAAVDARTVCVLNTADLA